MYCDGADCLSVGSCDLPTRSRSSSAFSRGLLLGDILLRRADAVSSVSSSTPTIGLACQNWSLIHPPPTERNDKVASLYLSYADMPNIGKILRDLQTKLPHEEMEISVVTDGSRVLGLGDLGVGGMGISQGKLSLYVAGGGVNPKAVRPLHSQYCMLILH